MQHTHGVLAVDALDFVPAVHERKLSKAKEEAKPQRRAERAEQYGGRPQYHEPEHPTTGVQHATMA